MKNKPLIFLFLILITIIPIYIYYKPFKNNKHIRIEKELKFSKATYRVDKRINFFLDEYFKDEKLENKKSYFMYIQEDKKNFYLTINSEIEKFQSSEFVPFGYIDWENKKIFVLSFVTDLFESNNNDLIDEFRKSDIMNSGHYYRKLWLLVISRYEDSYEIIKDANKIHEIISLVEIVRDE